MRRIIIDNDGGTDDFVAILYAVLSKKFDIEGITLVAGNTDVENVSKNAFKALEMAKVSPEEAKEIGVYLPENVKLDIISDGAQGENGLGGVNIHGKKGYGVNPEAAEKKLINIVKENPNQVSILATGPLTNIAKAIEQDPEFVNAVDELVIMGGDEGGGNITPYAEFNVYQDPEAAKKVFEAGFKKITMIGFNITKQVTLCPEIEHYLKENGKKGNFIYEITRVTADLDRGKNKVDGASMNDVLTALYLLDENGEMFKSKRARVEVDTTNNFTRGRTSVIDLPDTGSCNVVTYADGTKILRKLFTVLFPNRTNELEAALAKREERIAVRDYLLKMLPEKKNEILSLWNREGATRVMERMADIIYEKKGEQKTKKFEGNEH